MGGYGMCQWLFYTKSCATPCLIGNYVHDVLPTLSHYKLNLRLIYQKIEPDIPEGIILSQIPPAGKEIKPHQSIFVVTTKKPSAMYAPACIEKNITTLLPELQKQNIVPRIYVLPHQYPKDRCFAQSPDPDLPLEKNKLILYISAGTIKPIIWPQFIGLSLENTTSFLEQYTIKPYIINDTPLLHKPLSTYTIIDQRPVAGTVINVDEVQQLSVQLRIQ